jgi:hypothetical protein
MARSLTQLHRVYTELKPSTMSATELGGDDVVAGEEPEYEEKLDEAPRSILMGMMRQLKVGMDLSRITLPAFILEPRSFLEKCSDFMSHGHHILKYHTLYVFSAYLQEQSNFILSDDQCYIRAFLQGLIFFLVASISLCDTPDPMQRMLSVIRWYLSSWHLKPPVFACRS